MVISEEILKKYGFLLQPIKDLTKNWEIDVTNVLEEYLEDLEKMSFSIDNGNTVLNFAEASMLIQGTACVWSRKVEYLYILVKQALDMIANRQKGRADKNPDNSSGDKTEDPNFDDEDDKLLKLDDITILSKRELAANYDPIALIPLTPSAMLENDSAERGRLIITGNENDSVCHTNDFWENRFIPFETKISVLDRDSGGVLDEIIIPSLEDLENAPINSFSQTSAIDPTNHTMHDIPNDDGDEMEPADNGEEDVQDDPFVENMKKDETIVEKMQLRQRFTAVNPVNIESADFLPPVLDPYIENTMPTWVSKSFKKLKSFRIPASVMNKTRKRKLTSLPQQKVESISKYIMARSRRLKKRKCFDNDNPLSKFAEAEQRKRSQQWRVLMRHVVQAIGSGNVGLGLPAAEVGQDSVFDDNQMDPFGGDISAHSDAFSPDLDDLIADVANSRGQDLGPEAQIDDHSPTSYEDLVRHHVEKFYSAARRFKEETALAQRVKLWDEAITPRLAEQDQRPEFDIHKYGDVILKKFGQPQESRCFEDIVESPDTWYICRLFAATLQLANDKNFSVSKDDNFTKSVNTMMLTMLSQRRLCERFDDYSAQS